MPAGNKNNSENNLTLKEVVSDLGISESTVKKYIREFDLNLEKQSDGKAAISQETFQALSEIAKLRANGLSISEIKELKSQQPETSLIDEIENPDIAKSKKVSSPENNGVEEEVSVSLSKEEDPVAAVSDDLSGEENVESGSEETEEDDSKQTDETSDQPRRRRGFNYRYVERQISNDSKRISSLRRRLQNPNISIQEKLFFEEALERRILFLNGWKHILRWVSKR